MKLFYFILLSTILYSCSDNFEHSYKDYNDLNKENLRIKGWFPSLASDDSYNLKEVHTIGDIESYGRFSYRNRKKIDSLLSDTSVYKEINTEKFNNFLSRFKRMELPKWYLDKEYFLGKRIYQNGFMYFIDDRQYNTIYFAYTLK
jgi:hypothetical protein